MSCSYVDQLNSYARKRKTMKQVRTLILDASVDISTENNFFIIVVNTYNRVVTQIGERNS